MNKLLPNVSEIYPIKDNKSTFYDCNIKLDFERNNLDNKLRIARDIVRQSMIYTKFPNPNFDEELLCGDSYTSSKILIKYLKALNINNKAELVAVSGRKKVDLKSNPRTHFSVLIEDYNKSYLIDTAPEVGYLMGKTVELEENDIYYEYEIINENKKRMIDRIKMDIYSIVNKQNIDDIYLRFFEYKKFFDKFPVLNGLLLTYYEVIKKTDNRIRKNLKVFLKIR